MYAFLLPAASATEDCTYAGRCTASTKAAAGLTPQLVFNTVTLAVLPMYGLMVAFPRKQLVRVTT